MEVRGSAPSALGSRTLPSREVSIYCSFSTYILGTYLRPVDQRWLLGHHPEIWDLGRGPQTNQAASSTSPASLEATLGVRSTSFIYTSGSRYSRAAHCNLHR